MAEKVELSEKQKAFITLLDDLGMDDHEIIGMLLTTKDKEELMEEMILWMFYERPNRSEIVPHLLEKLCEMGYLGTSEQNTATPTDSR